MLARQGLLETVVVAYGPNGSGPFTVIHPPDFKGEFRLSVGRTESDDILTEVWSLDYRKLGQVQSVSPVDERMIEETLRRLDGTETFACGIGNLRHRCWLTCRGVPDSRLIEYWPEPPNFTYSGKRGSGIFILSRKHPPDHHPVRIRWQSNPDVFVDVRADSVLSLCETISIFTTFFRSRVIHQDFTTIPKPLNGYVT